MVEYFRQLAQRKIAQWAIAYAAAAWVGLQVLGLAASSYGWSPLVMRLAIGLALIGFLATLVLAWYHGERGQQKTSGAELLILAALLAVGGALMWTVERRQAAPATAASASAAAARATSAIDPHSIAVLPFVDMSQGHDQEYFSDGLSEELLNLLAQLPQLRVIARTSSFSFKDKEADVATIARALGVANVLEGSVRKSGNTLRITAQLIRASDSSHLWSQTYDRELTDVFKVQDEIAGAVVAALKVQLLHDQAMSNAHRSSNAEAYNQYLLGNEFRKRGNLDNWRRAIAAYLKAIALEPRYAVAYAGLAAARGSLADSLGDVALMQQALRDSETAVALGPELAEGYAVRGTSRLTFKRDWAGAEADFRKALALSPGASEVQGSYGRILIARGRVPEAIAASRKAIALDPLSADAWSQLGRLLNAVGQYGEARQALDRALEINPDSNIALFHRGMNSQLQGQYQEALAIYRRTGGGYGQAGVAMAEHSLRHGAESQQALNQEIAQFAQGAGYQIAEVYAWRGEPDQAFAWLERAYAQRDGGLTFIKADPLMKPLLRDPRFAALLAKLGLPK
jgi:serine/threonine-protein kinase